MKFYLVKRFAGSVLKLYLSDDADQNDDIEEGFCGVDKFLQSH